MSVTARPRLAAVGIEEEELGISSGRGSDRHELIKADAKPPIGEKTDRLGRKIERLFAGVDDEEVVTEPVHLDEGQSAAHGPEIGGDAPARNRGVLAPNGTAA